MIYLEIKTADVKLLELLKQETDLFPFFVQGSGPIKSIPILSQMLEIGIGLNEENGFLNLGLVLGEKQE